ncbi:MAG: NTP transferase domain-containing protein, partial [Acidobacteria bacterium]|nr:NTP transferase domain-containing protein [Acidobacteriota bacterium]
MLAAVILAAGESRRMGTPKALLPFPAGTVVTEGITT